MMLTILKKNSGNNYCYQNFFLRFNFFYNLRLKFDNFYA